jgi:hypothetical protein
MPIHVDQIIDDLCSGSLSLEAACQQLLEESQADPSGTRFWSQRVETAMKHKRISRGAARAMLDALEGLQTDKTLWIDSGLVGNDTPADAADRDRMHATEKLLASFVERTMRRPVAGPDVELPASPMTGPVEWYDSRTIMTEAGTNPADPINVTPGSVIKDRYLIVAHLGAGGIGQVFEAVDLARGGERVTLKVVAVNLRHQPDAFGALQTAVRRTQHLDHPNVVSIRNIDRHGDSVFLVMEPLRGRWLSGLIREVRGKGLPHETAWPIISGIASGLAYAHSEGVVHADLSPHAVFLCDDGTAKIMCFGLVDAVPTSNESLDVLDTLTLRAYTEAYAADPWAQQSRPHPADDLYPLGVIAYEMLTGMHPFQRSSLAVARQRQMKCAPIAGLGRRERKLIERCLSFERSQRPQSAERFVKSLQPSLLERVWA